ncbi:hypothetical protein [Microvirga lotononidis]|uniref:Uncharacterized protein n=1 Tax=Microvirga lotononidis TaxID=864069 RepID=I4Z304_9HYPH|nr:hypothetical protein [Microvirga lotononidis]EIM30596.1 hypothetical protein MicloDRAFT_00008460 [Microvirga lotononidis]WQO26424.1 hypothetical protein U0023_17255 [Microvirga lotononidis]
MTPQTILMLGLALRALIPAEMGEAASPPEKEAKALQARYEPASREVTNWRREAMGALEPKPVVAMVAFFRAERPFVTRCVKLNNYWCIKSARWNGELATDGEGHVGFATADHGADAAATLLRRYYLEFNRKSALDIVRRWAPAECNVATSLGDIALLAVRGIGGTVRAQYLASRRKKGGAVRYTAKAGPGGKPGRVSVVIPITPKTPQYRVPSIAEGMGEKPKPAQPPVAVAHRKPVKEPAVTASAAPKLAPRPVPKVQVASACPSEDQRHRNYASRMVEGLGLGPTDDLKLFAQDGTPQPNLVHVMLAMSSFELGALRASPDLVEEAVERAAARLKEGAGTEEKKADLSQVPPQSLER